MAVRKPLVLIGGVHKELPAADSLAVGWAWITGTPTTLAGYGITDAAPLSHVGAGGTAHANVVAAGAAGFMTGADKTKLDGVATGATANTGTVTSVAVANATGITWTGSPITTSGTLTPTLSANLQAWSGLATSSKANISGTVTLVDTNFRIATDASNNYIQSSTGNQVAGSWKDLVFGPFSSVTAHFKVTATGSLINGNSVWHAGNDTALGSEASTASTIVRRNAASDIFARLFRSTYGNQATISGAMAFRVNTTDNYIRFCSDTAAIRTFLDVEVARATIAAGGRLGADAQIIADWNTPDKNGWYMADGALNAPAAGWILGKETVHNPLWVTQEVWRFTAGTPGINTPIYRRSKLNNSWQAWSSNIYTDGHVQAGSKLYVREGTDNTAPVGAGRCLVGYYLSNIYDGSTLLSYDYTGAVYKPMRVEAASMTINPAGTQRLEVVNDNNGAVLLYGRGWLRHTGAATAGLWYSDSLNAKKFFAGVENDSTWGIYNTTNSWCVHWDLKGIMYVQNANSTTRTRQPRHFVQSTDPGLAASDGDIWTNTA